MKLLLDENLPHRLRGLLTGHEAFTVAYMKWNGIENGELLSLAAEHGFDATLVTKDLGVRYEQNVANLAGARWLFYRPNQIRCATFEPLVSTLLSKLESLKPKSNHPHWIIAGSTAEKSS